MPLNYFFLKTIPSLFYNQTFFHILGCAIICRWNVLWAWYLRLPMRATASVGALCHPHTRLSTLIFILRLLSTVWFVNYVPSLVSCQSVHSHQVSRFSSVEVQNHRLIGNPLPVLNENVFIFVPVFNPISFHFQLTGFKIMMTRLRE